MSIEAITEFLADAIRAGTPLLLATLGEIYAERSGILNLGVEGMMIVGAVVGFATTLSTGNPWLGLLIALLSGALLSLIHAFMSISLRANQVVSGLALTMLGLGLSSILGKSLVGVRLKSPIPYTPISMASEIPLLGAFLKQDPLIYASYIIAIILWIILFKTRIGICIRAVGENPASADLAGINVYLTRYLCTILGGALAGIAGAYLSLAYTPSWIEGMTAGQGWIAIALTIFSLWSPTRAIIGAYLFGGIRVLQYRLQPIGVSVPLLKTLPYLSTILVIIISSGERIRKRIGAPASLGQPFSREER